MANASVRLGNRPPPVKQPPRKGTKINLELTPEEAAFLIVILRKVGGSPDTTPRQYGASILDALLPGNTNAFNRITHHSYGGTPYVRECELFGYRDAAGIVFDSFGTKFKELAAEIANEGL